MTTARKADVNIGSKVLTIETGTMAKQAHGAVTVRLGDTIVLVSAVASAEPKEGSAFFPLTVDYRERTYAAGRIPGGFFKREGRPREREILSCRLVDRSIRPLFPEGFRNEVQIHILVLSSDQANDPDVLAMVGASAALYLSDIPFQGPIGAVRVGRLNGQFIVNPTVEEQDLSELDLVVAGTANAILMVEGGGQEQSEEIILEALALAQREIQTICRGITENFHDAAKPKMAFGPLQMDETLVAAASDRARDRLREALRIADKQAREEAFRTIQKETQSQLIERFPEQEKAISQIIDDIQYEEARAQILQEQRRADGRGLRDIRPLSSCVGILPRTHGSALFTRGQTQALVTVTLGTPADMQIMDELEGEYKERFLVHYNFPGFATGEPKPDRGPGRREIGHGALAKRALYGMLPKEEEFPYTIRVVSDILESNGSSSMASVTGGSLALFDAGIPLKGAVAGIAMGLIKEGDRYAILTDIMGLEDHLGDMDFKVAGTRQGVTGLQMDIKIEGISIERMREALEQAHVARLKILDHMDQTLPAPRPKLSEYAPRMVVVQIPVDKIGALIGPGGKNIRRIIEETGAEVEVEDDGRVFISSTDSKAVEMAKDQVEGLTVEAEVGKIYTGRVTRIMSIGAFVEILPGKEGLVRTSQLSDHYVESPGDVVKEGDEIQVKVIEIDGQGRINLSRRAVLQPGSEVEWRSGPPRRPGPSHPVGGRPPRKPGGRGTFHSRDRRPR